MNNVAMTADHGATAEVIVAADADLVVKATTGEAARIAPQVTISRKGSLSHKRRLSRATTSPHGRFFSYFNPTLSPALTLSAKE